jgi:Protein of unknown function (DUF2971)
MPGVVDRRGQGQPHLAHDLDLDGLLALSHAALPGWYVRSDRNAAAVRLVMDLELDHPDLLFHYTRRDVVFEHIFDKRRLMLGLLRNTRDPREARRWQFRITGQGSSPFNRYTKEQVWEVAHDDSLIKKGVKVLCLTQNPRVDGSDQYLEGQPYTEPAGWGRPRMWDQYGEGHRGLCLALDRNRLGDSVLKSGGGQGINIFNDRVHYTLLDEFDDMQVAFDLNIDQIQEIGPLEYMMQHRKRFYHEFFMRKHIDWRDEAEYRWICFDDDENSRYIDIDSLVAVIVGDAFPPAYKRLLIAFCEELRVPAAEMRWKNGCPKRPHWFYRP